VAGKTGDGRVQRRIDYSPLASQIRFHKSGARFKGFSGPIGSGKSQALCQEAIKLTYLNPGRLGLIGAPTYPMLRDSTQATMLEILDGNRIPYELNKAENSMVMKDTRARILFRAVDEFERLRGTNLAWFGIDELTYTPEGAWLRLEGRLRDPKAKRLCGFAVWTPKGFDWVFQRFVAAAVEGYEVILAPAFENRFLLERVPDFYERLERSYDEKFYQQEVMGSYLSISEGMVYHAFLREGNVGKAALEETEPLLWALDFNVDPMSSLIAQRDGDRIRVLDEIVIKRASTGEACEEFLERYRGHGAGVVVYGDASGHHWQTSGTTDYRILRTRLREAGIRVGGFKAPVKNPPVRERVALVNAKLRGADGDVHLRIDPKCRELIVDLEQVSYKSGSSVIDKDRDTARSHLSDALGYLIWEEFGVKPRAGEQGKRLL